MRLQPRTVLQSNFVNNSDVDDPQNESSACVCNHTPDLVERVARCLTMTWARSISLCSLSNLLSLSHTHTHIHTHTHFLCLYLWSISCQSLYLLNESSTCVCTHTLGLIKLVRHSLSKQIRKSRPDSGLDLSHYQYESHLNPFSCSLCDGKRARTFSETTLQRETISFLVLV